MTCLMLVALTVLPNDSNRDVLIPWFLMPRIMLDA